MRPYWPRLLAALFGLMLAATAFLALGEGIKRAVDGGFAARDAATLDTVLLVMIALALAQGLGVYIRWANIAWVNQRVIADLRERIYAHLLALSPAHFDRERSGELLSRLTADTATLDGLIANAFSWALRNLVMMAGALIMLALTSPKLLAFVLVGTPLVIAPFVLLGRRVRRLARSTQDRLAEVMAGAGEAIGGIRTVQAFAREPEERHRFHAALEALFRQSVARERLSVALAAITIVLAFVAVALVVWVGGHDVLTGRMSAGELSAFVFYAVIVASAVGAIAEVYGQLKRAAGATERIRELLATPSDITAPPSPVPIAAHGPGAIAVERVRFAYPTRPSHWALDDFSLEVAPGEVVALVGPSGAGKSTVFQLLLRFYDPQAGAIRVDGVDARAADPHAWRRQFALVAQDPVIFSASLEDNVRYGRPEASAAELRAACDAAHVTEFAERLPEGFATRLGERGVLLSGGQRQRVAIARAILAARPILLLDEATSALDAESEALVTEAIERLARRQTTLVIAHRLSTVQTADRIVVIDRGRVVGSGTHAELLATNPLYARLAARQLQG
ncbi:MAG: ABC transporter transmembrane domain-containing protein [Casimicrobiaceae bacterium]|nr:ABC transporter transmembrane domain-containing protein [Casimicrobiaceae bacterium]